MTLLQIKYVLAIAEHDSMNKAAEALYISQPSLTGAVRELEKETGISLFLRTSRGVTLTAEGAEFLTYARQVYQQYELLNEKYVTGKRKRRFSVSTQHYSFAVKAFVEMVKRFGTENYELSIRETTTYDVINSVGTMTSEIGVMYLSSFNRKVLTKLLSENELEFHRLTECCAYVYLWKNHPLANEKSITMEMLADYPCLSFEQGERGSLYFAEEILGEKEYSRMIHTTDRATMLDMMVGLNGYTLCSGITCTELTGSQYIVVPFQPDESHKNSVMEIGYITKKNSTLTDIGDCYVTEMKRYLNLL